MTEEEKNIEWICARTLLDKNNELVPIILKMLSETYINGLKQGHFDRDMDLQNLIQKQQAELQHQIEKRNNQQNELAILNEKQKEFNKLTNTVKSYKGMFKRQQVELENLKRINKELTTERDYYKREYALYNKTFEEAGKILCKGE